jgi:C4-dicarboxylate-specific signal transduction histidine kinase
VRPGNTATSGPVAITDVVQSVCTYVDVLARHNQVSLEVACDVDQQIAGPSDDVEQTLICLLVNAIEAARYDRDRSPRVRVEVVGLPDQTIRLAVYDSGKGPSSDIAPRLFEPFLTDKPTGTGIGLALAKELIAARGGQLTWRREAEWTCFEITLPVAASHEVKHALAGCG